MDERERASVEGKSEVTSSRRKSKWAAGVLSFFFPGLGQLYAGAMQRGLFFMLLFAGNIFGVVLVSMEGIVPLIVLLSVLIPVVYLYSLFDALQITERYNNASEARQHASGIRTAAAVPVPESARRGSLGSGQTGLIVVGSVAVLFMAVEQPGWFEGVFNGSGALIGAGLMIFTGVLIFFAGSNRKR